MACFYSFMILLVIFEFCVFGFKAKEVITNSPEIQLMIFIIGRYILSISLVISIIFMILFKLLKDNITLDAYIPKGYYVEAICQIPLADFNTWTVHLRNLNNYTITINGTSIQSAFNNAIKEVKNYEKKLKKEKK
jgi:hypothetical protein